MEKVDLPTDQAEEDDFNIPTSAGVLAKPPGAESDEEDSPEEQTKYKSSEILIKYEDYPAVKGTLEITTKKISWKNEGSEFGPAFPYLDFVLHAVSREETPSILTQLKIDLHPSLYFSIYGKEEEKEESSEDEYEYPDPEENCIALYFIPDDEKELDAIFDTFSECSALNPDPAEDTKEDDQLYSEHDFFDITNIDKLNLNEENQDQPETAQEVMNKSPKEDHKEEKDD
ncbi:unnamed protein product [Moneuplotes crassus]|uniref:Uncharacterized protein n=1 Tax=Euplotes crassus TaxID=5936 RepID=A0AAD1XN63_EUPCR|nr:unnamed protein product [Moneuplotes crassus]